MCLDVISSRFHNMVDYTVLHFTLVTILQYFARTVGERQNVCQGFPFKASCNAGDVLVVERAEFGRMEPGRCITSEFMGCRNDVLFLADRWCSGRSSCEFRVTNVDLQRANRNCDKNLIAYLQATYTCIKVKTMKKECRKSPPITLNHRRGMLSSIVADEQNCGTATTPWRIEGQPGQTIDIELIDFKALDRSSKTSPKCADVYGHVIEKSLNINQTICGQSTRESIVYSSKTHSIDLAVKRNSGFHFLLKYQLNGCSELHPPKDAWYKRTRNEASFGCEKTGNTWTLTCRNNQWEGTMGNCTPISMNVAALAASKEQTGADEPFEHFGLIVVTGIVGGTLVLAVAIVVFGLMYVNRYREKKERLLVSLINKKKEEIKKREQGTPPTIAPRAQFRPLSTVTNASEGYLLPSTANTANKRISGVSEAYLQPVTPNPGFMGTGRSSVMSTSFDRDSVLLGVYETPPGSERQSRNSAFLNRFSLREIALKKNPIYDNSRCGSSIDGDTEMTAIAVFDDTSSCASYPSYVSPCSTGNNRITLKGVAIKQHHRGASLDKWRGPDAIQQHRRVASLDKRRCPSPPPETVEDSDTETTALTWSEGDRRFFDYESQCDTENPMVTSSIN